MKGVDSILQVVRLLAAFCVLGGVLAFGNVQAVRAGDGEAGGCTFAFGRACATNGGTSELRKCKDNAEGCTTCYYSQDETCYHDDGPHLDDYFDEPL